MSDPLLSIGRIAGSGMEAQLLRMRVVSENNANARSTGAAPGAEPYPRKPVEFASEPDRALGFTGVSVRSIGVDRATAFTVEHDPGNPAADQNGDVKLPNVNVLVEMADLRDAGRSYSANLQMMKQARSMISMTLDLLRGG